MTTITKRRITEWSSVAGAFTIVYCTNKEITYGIGGDPARAEQWFGLAVIVAAFSIVCGVYYYYFREKIKLENNSENRAFYTLVETLTHSANKDNKRKPEKPNNKTKSS